MKNIKYFGVFIFIGLMAVGITACSGRKGIVRGEVAANSTAIVQLDLPAQDLVVGSNSEAGLCKENSDDCDTEASPAPVSQTSVPTAEAVIGEKNPDPTIMPEAVPTLGSDDWQDFPVIPLQVSERAKEIYREGLAKGNYPDRFSKIGDCQNINTYFLALYDDPSAYTLGSEYDYLQGTIDYYSGMWSRDSISVKGGFNVANIFNPWFNNKELCGANESPVDCELRVNQPSVVLVSMEAWWNGDASRYAGYYRKIVETVINYGAVPILATKADNLEGNNDINRAIVEIAHEFDVPVWNFWRSVQDIPDHGLEDDGFHITHGLNDFSNPVNLKQAWPLRNLTALEAIDAVRNELSQP